MRVLLVTPRTLAGFITVGLYEEGHVVHWVPHACVGQQCFQAGDYDAIIVDADLSNGKNIARIATERRRPPLLTLTRRDWVKPLAEVRSGDGYLVKPFRFDRLLKWLASLTSQHSAARGTW